MKEAADPGGTPLGVDRGPAIVATIAVAVLVAFQPPGNASLAKHVGDLGAAFISLSISLFIVAVLLLAAGELGELRGISSFRPEHALGGIAGFAIVFVSLVAVRTLGVAGVAALLVAGQLAASLVIDRYGWLGVDQVDTSLARIAGIVLLIVGTVLVTSR